jgi:hypothetical protein
MSRSPRASTDARPSTREIHSTPAGHRVAVRAQVNSLDASQVIDATRAGRSRSRLSAWGILVCLLLSSGFVATSGFGIYSFGPWRIWVVCAGCVVAVALAVLHARRAAPDARTIPPWLPPFNRLMVRTMAGTKRGLLRSPLALPAARNAGTVPS